MTLAIQIVLLRITTESLFSAEFGLINLFLFIYLCFFYFGGSTGLTTTRQIPPSDEAPEFTRLPLKSANRSAVYDEVCTDSPQTPDPVLVISSPCKKQASV